MKGVILFFLVFISVYKVNTQKGHFAPAMGEYMGDCFIHEEKAPKQIKNYVFLGHIYQNDFRINPQIEQLDFGQFDQIWLGGDLLIETTKDQSNLDYLDCLFDLSNPKTKWALGNHDVRNGNVKWITEKTKRGSFYTSHSDGITYFVLNANGLKINDLDESFVKSQYRLLKTVCDTITNSSHFIILSHHCPWQDVDSIITTGAHVDASKFAFNVRPIQNFYDAIYKPLLEKVQDKGVDVLFISGDFGQYRNGYDYKSNSGVRFLGSGILPEADDPKYDFNKRFFRYNLPDSILVFEHDIVNQKLQWDFRLINDYY